MATYYFFRDLDNNSNLEYGKTYHASGYVEKIYGAIGTESKSGKDVAVIYWNPFSCAIECAWREFCEIELFEVNEFEYRAAVAKCDAVVRVTENV